MIPITGFYPDADPTSAGVIIDSDNIIPTLKGSYKAAPTATTTGYAALAAECLGIVEAVLLDATSRLIAGTDTKLYEGSALTWTDRSRAGNYTTGAKRWRFGVFGNVVISCDGVDILQASTGAGVAFADVAGSPKCKVMDVSQGFVMMGATNEATYGDQSDRWWCSAIYDYTDWTPAVATQCTTGRLVDVPGPIRAMKALGSNFVAYKDRGLFVGQYIGSPLVWQWTQVPSEVGCSSHESIANVPGVGHIFIGQENIYLFNGSGLPSPIGDGIKDWFFTDMNNAYRNNIRTSVDKVRSNVWFFYPRNDSASGNPTGAIIYNYKANKWGVWRGNVEAAVEYLTGAVTYDTSTGTYDAQTFSFDDPKWTNTSPFPAIVDSTHTLMTMTAAAGTSNITFGDVGDDTQYSMLGRVKVRFLSAPTSATMTNQYKQNEGESLTTDSTNTMVDSKFDFHKSARWHRVTLQTIGDCEFSGIAYDLRKDGIK
jgi:hypothetical protein